MAIPDRLICSSHTISGVMPGGPVASRHGFAERVAAASAVGYRGLCLHLRDLRAQLGAGLSFERMRDILEAHGMTEISLEFLTGWFLDGAEAGAFREDEATALAAARALGARSLNVGGDFRHRGLPRDFMHRRFGEFCARAGEAGLAVALEFVPWSDVPDVATALAMTDGIGNAGLVVDSWHVFRGGVPLSDLRRIPGGRILSIQINDAAAAVRGTLAEDTLCRLPCGEGVFDLAGFLDALDAAGASVPPSVEIIAPGFAALDLGAACARSAAGARRLLDGLALRRQ